MAKIVGAEGVSRDVLAQELQRGGRFVMFQYVVSVLVMSFKRVSPIYYIRPGESPAAKGLPWTLLALVVGWWGVPWGFIWTPMAIYKNLTGGIDVTADVAAEILGGAVATAATAPPPAPASGQDRVLAKRTGQLSDRLAYLVTFQKPGCAPMELEVTAEWHGYLNPGDAGSLTLQNGQFWGFGRTE